MHDSALAQLPYYLCGFASLASATRLALGVTRRARPRSHLLGAGAFLALGAAFSLLTITAGPAPMVSRGAVAEVIRWVFLAGGSLWCAWLASVWRRGARGCRGRPVGAGRAGPADGE